MNAQPVEAVAHPRSTIRPVAVYSFDGAMKVMTRRGVGFRFDCSCGERGPMRRTVAAARADRRQHDSTHE